MYIYIYSNSAGFQRLSQQSPSWTGLHIRIHKQLIQLQICKQNTYSRHIQKLQLPVVFVCLCLRFFYVRDKKGLICQFFPT